ncbi:MAG: hypothetical protein R3C14_01985 [Caldilineaceae bacterium]
MSALLDTGALLAAIAGNDDFHDICALLYFDLYVPQLLRSNLVAWPGQGLVLRVF